MAGRRGDLWAAGRTGRVVPAAGRARTRRPLRWEEDASWTLTRGPRAAGPWPRPVPAEDTAAEPARGPPERPRHPPPDGFAVLPVCAGRVEGGGPLPRARGRGGKGQMFTEEAAALWGEGLAGGRSVLRAKQAQTLRTGDRNLQPVGTSAGGKRDKWGGVCPGNSTCHSAARRPRRGKGPQEELQVPAVWAWAKGPPGSGRGMGDGETCVLEPETAQIYPRSLELGNRGVSSG